MSIGRYVLSAALAVFLLAATAATSSEVTAPRATPGQRVPRAADTEFRDAMAWAFPPNTLPEGHTPKRDMRAPLHVPGSARTYTLAEFEAGTPDWFPQDHPPMPRIVAHGREPAWACADCHLPNGQGRPENAPIAGLPAAYIIEQIKAFRSCARRTGRPETAKFMPAEARNVTDGDLKLAAAYFSSVHYKPWIRVIETATVPKTHIAHWMLVADADGTREPIGDRIIETSTGIERTELRDTRFGFVAYVPPGSIARGAVLATKGNGAAQACESCHGANLQGVGMIPPLAGRSPTYLVRQLILFRTGQRRATATLPMQHEVAALSLRDMIDAVAFAASRKP